LIEKESDSDLCDTLQAGRRRRSLVLYYLTSTYFEGRKCPLAQFGKSRHERPKRPPRGSEQIALEAGKRRWTASMSSGPALPAEQPSSKDTVRCYESLAVVERAFDLLQIPHA
jgi:hypothetical protein